MIRHKRRENKDFKPTFGAKHKKRTQIKSKTQFFTPGATQKNKYKSRIFYFSSPLLRSVEKLASHLITNYITLSKSCQSLCLLESWNRCTCTSLQFLIGQVCSEVWCRPYQAADFTFFELPPFQWSPSKVKVGAFYPFTLKVGSKYTYIILEVLV